MLPLKSLFPRQLPVIHLSHKLTTFLWISCGFILRSTIQYTAWLMGEWNINGSREGGSFFCVWYNFWVWHLSLSLSAVIWKRARSKMRPHCGKQGCLILCPTVPCLWIHWNKRYHSEFSILVFKGSFITGPNIPSLMSV
jgi:hypothetical protein